MPQFLFQLSKSSKLIAPAINVHDAITRTMVNNFYCQKESIIDVIKVHFQQKLVPRLKLQKLF